MCSRMEWGREMMGKLDVEDGESQSLQMLEAWGGGRTIHDLFEGSPVFMRPWAVQIPDF